MTRCMPGPWPRVWPIAVAIILGIGMAAQARINGELGVRLGNSVQAALVSFTVGLIALAVFAVVHPPMRRGFRRIPEQLHRKVLLRWHLLGGIAGAAFVVAQAFAVPFLGVALFTVVGVGVETISALVVDRVGVGPGGKRPVTSARLIGAMMALAAVLLASVDKFNIVGLSLIAIASVMLAKIGTTVQVAINARVAAASRSSLAAASISFAVGTVFLLVVFAIMSGTSIIAPSTEWFDWWLYTGGLLGVAAIVGAAHYIPRIGVLVFGLCAVAGQVCGSLLIDKVAPVDGSPLSTLTYIGSLLTLISVFIALGAFSARSRAPHHTLSLDTEERILP